jgi:hypothetical protein
MGDEGLSREALLDSYQKLVSYPNRSDSVPYIEVLELFYEMGGLRQAEVRRHFGKSRGWSSYTFRNLAEMGVIKGYSRLPWALYVLTDYGRKNVDVWKEEQRAKRWRL